MPRKSNDGKKFHVKNNTEALCSLCYLQIWIVSEFRVAFHIQESNFTWNNKYETRVHIWLHIFDESDSSVYNSTRPESTFFVTRLGWTELVISKGGRASFSFDVTQARLLYWIQVQPLDPSESTFQRFLSIQCSLLTINFDLIWSNVSTVRFILEERFHDSTQSDLNCSYEGNVPPLNLNYIRL